MGEVVIHLVGSNLGMRRSYTYSNATKANKGMRNEK